jgi:hypothetical protein
LNRASGGTPGKPGFCRAKMRVNDYGFHSGTSSKQKNYHPSLQALATPTIAVYFIYKYSFLYSQMKIFS